MNAHGEKDSCELSGENMKSLSLDGERGYLEDELISLDFEDKRVVRANVVDGRKISDSTELHLKDCKPDVDVEDGKPVDATYGTPTLNTRKKRRLECRSCPRRFNTLQARLNHEEIHKPPRICQYDRCAEKPKSFSRNSPFRRHIRNAHPKIWASDYAPSQKKKTVRNIPESNMVLRRLKCNVALSHLARHTVIHERRNEKISHSIEGCYYQGKNSEALRLKTYRRKTRLPCPACGYANTNKALKDHGRFHNNPLSRPFQCVLCLKNYPTLVRLQRHCFVHTKEKPVVCGHCEYASASRYQVKSHVSNVHGNIKFPFFVFALGDRECLHCEVTLPLAEFIVHSMGHAVPVVMIERLETRWS